MGSSDVVTYNQSVPFSCTVPYDHNSLCGENIEGIPQSFIPCDWRTIICQLDEGGDKGSATIGSFYAITGGLASEFVLLPLNPLTSYNDSYTPGNAYIVLNVTAGSDTFWKSFTNVRYDVVKQPMAYKERGEWLDLSFGNGQGVLSATFCYSAFDIADLPIQITSNMNRTEPIPSYDAKNLRYTFDGYRDLLGQNKASRSLDDRGVLKLEGRSSWIANKSEYHWLQPFVRDFANLAGPGVTGTATAGNAGNYSAFMFNAILPLQDEVTPPMSPLMSCTSPSSRRY
jgi:hypothetical protein